MNLGKRFFLSTQVETVEIYYVLKAGYTMSIRTPKFIRLLQKPTDKTSKIPLPNFLDSEHTRMESKSVPLTRKTMEELVTQTIKSKY